MQSAGWLSGLNHSLWSSPITTTTSGPSSARRRRRRSRAACVASWRALVTSGSSSRSIHASLARAFAAKSGRRARSRSARAAERLVGRAQHRAMRGPDAERDLRHARSPSRPADVDGRSPLLVEPGPGQRRRAVAVRPPESARGHVPQVRLEEQGSRCRKGIHIRSTWSNSRSTIFLVITRCSARSGRLPQLGGQLVDARDR